MRFVALYVERPHRKRWQGICTTSSYPDAMTGADHLEYRLGSQVYSQLGCVHINAFARRLSFSHANGKLKYVRARAQYR